ncbi:MAG: hypothetical protein NTY19_23735 [Planctomycetota bacterium]|nr:hypothetical protein [Planctomycetota bacterium]
MGSSYVEKAREWAREADNTADYAGILEQIEYLAHILFHEYKPSKAAGEKPILDRLTDWLNCAELECDQKTLFRLVPELLFVGSQEFDCLYQAAFNGPIARWLLDQEGLQLDASRTPKRLRKAEQTTWFCAITDSMQIAEFYHLNHIEGVDVRPVWHTLRKFLTEDAVQKLDAHMRTQGFRRIVLLEDFVGTGTQMEGAVRFAAALPGRFPILLCPLVICPKGAEKARDLQREIGHLTFSPVFELPESAFLSSLPVEQETGFMKELREAVIRLQPRLINPKCKYGPFGFRRTGALVVLHTNCPNNTLPIIHHLSSGGDPWTPLFRRSERT